MTIEMLQEILIPFVGTTLGAGCVFFVKGKLNLQLQRLFTGFAAGVMVAASIWSLLIPSLESAAHLEKWAFVPATVGFWLGIIFLAMLDKAVPHLHINSETAEGPKSRLQKTTMMILALVLHNIPEGMAVGVLYAGALMQETDVTVAAALVLSLGIAIQNFPEGAIISIPLHGEGMKKSKAFTYGMLSGIVEPLAAVATILVAEIVVPALPYMLGFAAGAMIYVVVEELIPESQMGEHSNIGTIGVAIGFTAIADVSDIFIKVIIISIACLLCFVSGYLTRKVWLNNMPRI